ncbi:MAG TPA: PA2779 family protein [Desulfobacterales bacterium]|nr:PA2779 family protein [Desulfobacterales bacterium]HSM90374.1 PA2779 family protein [Desulfobacterales bacterium]
MIGLRRKGQPVFVLMTVLALLIAIPHPSALAALIPTDVANDVVQGREARERIMRFMAREDVRAALVAQGIDPDEADARVVTLTDAEIAQIDGQIEKLPAGGFLEFAIAVLIIALLVIVILKVAGKIK